MINHAYEILSDEGTRASYDGFQANPNQNEYWHRTKFQYAKYGPKTDPKIVIFVFLLMYSVFQYTSKRITYK